MQIRRTQASLISFRLRRYIEDQASVNLTAEEQYSQTAAIFGPRGPIGASGDGARISWSPPSAQSSWLIPHNLGFIPVVEIRDSTGAVIYTNVTHLDLNTCLIEFAQPVLGTAELR